MPSFEKYLPDYPRKLAILMELAWLAQTSNNHNILIPGAQFDECIKKYFPMFLYNSEKVDILNHLRTLGLLESQYNTTKLSVNNNRYYFLHLTFQEYFAAKYWVKLFLDPNTKAQAEQNLKIYKYNQRFEVIWPFVSGLLSEMNDEIHDEFLALLDAEPKDLGLLYHSMLLMRCMDECQMKVSLLRRNKFLKDLSSLITSCVKDKRIGYSIISNYLALSQCVYSQSEIVETINNLLRNNLVRENVVSMLKNQMKLPLQILELIYSLLDDTNKWVQADAVRVIGCKDEIAFKDIREKFNYILENGDPWVRIAVIKTIAIRKDISTEDSIWKKILIILEKDNDTWVKRTIIFSLSDRIDELKEFKDILNRLLNSSDPKIQEAASLVLKITKPSQSYLKELGGCNEWVKDAAMAVFDHHKNIFEEIHHLLRSFIQGNHSERKKLVYQLALNIICSPVQIPEHIFAKLIGFMQVEDSSYSQKAMIIIARRANVPENIIQMLQINTPSISIDISLDNAINFFDGISEDLSMFEDIEIIDYHPVSTIVDRLMSNKKYNPKIIPLLVIKLLMINIPIYGPIQQDDKLFIKLGNEFNIYFENEDLINQFKSDFCKFLSGWVSLKSDDLKGVIEEDALRYTKIFQSPKMIATSMKDGSNRDRKKHKPDQDNIGKFEAN